MVSLGPDTQSYNFTHMYSFPDLRGNDECSIRPLQGAESNSIYNFLKTNPQFSRFKMIVDRASLMGQLNDVQANFTVLVPDDASLSGIPDEYFSNMDIGLAKQIVNCSCINNRIKKKILTSSPVAYYYTQNPRMRMYVTNIGGKTMVNNCAVIKKFDILLVNGVIHVINGMIAPNEDHFMN